MANTTDPFAETVHGTNPQYLIEKITRLKIYQCDYWKTECFGLTAETIVDKAVALNCCGGTYGGNVKPTDFLSLTLKMLQLQPDKDIVIAFIQNDDFKYLRLLGAMYMRLVGKPVEIYKYLEPLYNDYRKVAHRGSAGWSLKHVDELIDSLLVDEIVFDVALPHLPKRMKLEELGLLEPRKSALDAELENILKIKEEAAIEQKNKAVPVDEKKRSPLVDVNGNSNDTKNAKKSFISFDEEGEDGEETEPEVAVAVEKADKVAADDAEEEGKVARGKSPEHRRDTRSSQDDNKVDRSRSANRSRDRGDDRSRRHDSRDRDRDRERRKDSRDRDRPRRGSSESEDRRDRDQGRRRDSRDRNRSRRDRSESRDRRDRRRERDDSRDRREPAGKAEKRVKREEKEYDDRTHTVSKVSSVSVSQSTALKVSDEGPDADFERLLEKEKPDKKTTAGAAKKFDKMFKKTKTTSVSATSASVTKSVPEKPGSGKVEEFSVEYWNLRRDALGMKKLK